jgi:hypothetical protein
MVEGCLARRKFTFSVFPETNSGGFVSNYLISDRLGAYGSHVCLITGG